MPLLGGLLVTLFTGLVDFFVRFFTRDVALRLAFGALLVAGFATLYAAIAAALAAVSVVTPDAVLQGFSWFLPANTAACVSAMLATDAACTGFRLYVLGVAVR